LNSSNYSADGVVRQSTDQTLHIPAHTFKTEAETLNIPFYPIPSLKGPDLQNGIQKAAYIILGFCIKNPVVRNT